MTDKYYSFLLRMWRINSGEPASWRVMLEDPHTHEVLAFDGLEAFFIYLEELILENEIVEHD